MTGAPGDGAGANRLRDLEAAALDLALQLLAAARMAAVLGGMVAACLGRLPAACPFRSGPLHEAYHSGRWQARPAVGDDPHAVH